MFLRLIVSLLTFCEFAVLRGDSQGTLKLDLSGNQLRILPGECFYYCYKYPLLRRLRLSHFSTSDFSWCYRLFPWSATSESLVNVLEKLPHPFKHPIGLNLKDAFLQNADLCNFLRMFLLIIHSHVVYCNLPYFQARIDKF